MSADADRFDRRYEKDIRSTGCGSCLLSALLLPVGFFVGGLPAALATKGPDGESSAAAVVISAVIGAFIGIAMPDIVQWFRRQRPAYHARRRDEFIHRAARQAAIWRDYQRETGAGGDPQLVARLAFDVTTSLSLADAAERYRRRLEGDPTSQEAAADWRWTELGYGERTFFPSRAVDRGGEECGVRRGLHVQPPDRGGR